MSIGTLQRRVKRLERIFGQGGSTDAAQTALTIGILSAQIPSERPDYVTERQWDMIQGRLRGETWLSMATALGLSHSRAYLLAREGLRKIVRGGRVPIIPWNKQMPIALDCSSCGAPFERQAGYVARQRKKGQTRFYCSQRCANAGKKAYEPARDGDCIDTRILYF